MEKQKNPKRKISKKKQKTVSVKWGGRGQNKLVTQGPLALQKEVLK
jgi:hypothetical protein